MTPLEQEIIKALRDTERGKKFVKNWEFKRGDWFFNSEAEGDDGINIIGYKSQADNINRNIKSFCFLIPLPSEPQMLDAIEKAGYYNLESICYNKSSRYDFFIRGGTPQKVICKKGKTRLEAIQRAFLAVVLGIKEK